MDLFRRKLWGDRVTWILVAIATMFVVNQYLSRGGQSRLYILYAWAVVVAWLVFFSELRLGRREPRLEAESLFAGWAAFVGEERLDPDGQRTRGWRGTAPGIFSLEPIGMRWVPRGPTDAQADPRAEVSAEGAEGMLFDWPDVFTWRLVGVVPFVWRASGYLLVSLYGGRELIFHIHGIARWRQALREAMIVLPTYAAADVPAIAPPVAPLVPAAAVLDGPPDVGPPPEAGVEAPAHETGEPAPYEPVIGIECHVELDTASKMFCGCPTTFGAEPNTHVCEVCTGQPGSLPLPNRVAIEYALKIALALNCTIVGESIFHRKNYFYPDMPKNYQISQYDIPLAKGGYLSYELDGETRRVGIERVHIEEDTGKTLHEGEGGRIGEAGVAKIDYNRAGIPLVEIVTEPDIHTPEDARAYVAELRTLLQTLGVSDVRMEEGSMRCDANVSVRPSGSTELGTKTEVKNVNSLRSLQRALSHEVERQVGMVRSGAQIVQETRHFDEKTGVTIGGRAKEGSSDYRYFPDPDLVPIAPSMTWVDQIRATIPELPAQRRQRFVSQYSLGPQDARTLTAHAGLADAFEEATRASGGRAASIARWYVGEMSQIGNERSLPPHSLGVTPAHVAELQGLIDDGTISDSTAKGEVLKQMVASGRTPTEIVAEAGLAQIADSDEVSSIVDEVIAAHPHVVEQFRGGKTGALNALIGPVMKRTGGRANAQLVQQLLHERLG